MKHKQKFTLYSTFSLSFRPVWVVVGAFEAMDEPTHWFFELPDGQRCAVSAMEYMRREGGEFPALIFNLSDRKVINELVERFKDKTTIELGRTAEPGG